MSLAERKEFYKSVVDTLTGEGRTPVLLWGGMGQGKTTALRQITPILQSRSRCLQIFLPLHDVCYSPEFIDEHAGRIIRNSLEANAEGLVDPFDEAREAHAGEKLRFLSALNDLSEKFNVDIVVLIDEIYDLNVLKNFPDHGTIFEYFVRNFVEKGKLRFLFTTAFRRKVLEDFTSFGIEIEAHPVPPLSVDEIVGELNEKGFGRFSDLAPEIAIITGGVHGYVKAFIDHALRGEPPITMDTVVSSLMPGAALDLKCRFNYEYLVGKSRGEGVIRYLLAVMCRLEMPNLTEIARHINRSLGVTKDYLKWMLAVGLIEVERKRYWFPDELLRTWIRLYRSGDRPSREEIENELNQMLDIGYKRLRGEDSGVAEAESTEESSEKDAEAVAEIVMPTFESIEPPPRRKPAESTTSDEEETTYRIPSQHEIDIEELD